MQPINPSALQDPQVALNSFFQVLSSNIGLGSVLAVDSNGTPATFNQDNGSGVLIRVGSLANPFALPNHWSAINLPVVITHNLERIPIGYMVCSKTKACDIYTSSPPVSTLNTITLNITDNTADTLLYIF